MGSFKTILLKIIWDLKEISTDEAYTGEISLVPRPRLVKFPDILQKSVSDSPEL